ncbi:RICIN domain-containing protein [Streptomyces rimosus subsp. rimosus ATCC 10970]|uniref:RICIN domain-containing protein n=2 Tax=Streptomyces rimosus subsp. rimosus TaxID=132474 RepID=A0A8A1UGM0_STRR1|nr:hypothetical protein [Streptomyces sp. SID5471]QDA08952.1 hypothetical protein CTZ40_39655 [Streptomyces rimosus]QST79007.1 RICIN domain-containing protein [Streptomyces rimosus subsp. rimosus ATCC 10970]QTL91099.1 RICIN domain-containing protein [Streptomyces rimosus subsp. rimosus]QEV80231.1 hypothetical protein CP984_39615 [Streptomyces rimosus]
MTVFERSSRRAPDLRRASPHDSSFGASVTAATGLFVHLSDLAAVEPPRPVKGRGVSGAEGLAAVGDGAYVVRNVGSGLLLEVEDGRKGSGANVRQGKDDGSPGQLWRITEVHPGSGLRHLTNVGSGKRLDVTGASTENGANVQQWKANNYGAQEWLLEQHVDAPGTFTLTNYASGLLLEVADDSAEPGANVQQWEDRDRAGQWWRLESR